MREAGGRASMSFRRIKPAAAILILCGIPLATGCSGGRGVRPSLPDVPPAELPRVLAEADSAAAMGSNDEARDGYVRAAAAARKAGLHPLEARAELGAGLASLALGEAEPARRSILRAIEIDPNQAPAHVALGRYFTALRRYRDAKTEFDRAAALDTVSAEPLYRLGVAYAEAGETALATEALLRALAREPGHGPSQTALHTLLEARYVAAGLPSGYGSLRGHTSVSRGELGVALAAELGADPERPVWRTGSVSSSDSEEARGAWGERWLRVSMARGWIVPYPDGSHHLGDPVTRGALALLVAEIERTWSQEAGVPGGSRGGAEAGGAASGAPPAASEAGPGEAAPPTVPESFPDLGARHYLGRAARAAARMGLPLRAGGRFDPWTAATGLEVLTTLKGLARSVGAQPIVTEEPPKGSVVK